ncbi:MAG: tetratricopeptide repeat protein, partial [Cyanobacteria bacterium J06636_28]
MAMPARANLATADLMQQGQRAYGLGQYQAAAEVWQRVVQQGLPLERASGLSNLGLAHLQLGDYAEATTAIAAALEQVERAGVSPQQQRVLAQALSTQGKLYMAQGKLSQALTVLKQAETAYGGDEAGVLRSQLNQAQILRVQGHYRQTLKQLDAIATDLDALPNSSLKATGLRQLGNALLLNGDSQGAKDRLNQSLAVADAISSAADATGALLSLGNVQYQLGEPAAGYYQQAAAAAPTTALRLQAQVNLIGTWVKANNVQAAQELLPTVYSDLTHLSPGRTAVTTR